MNGKKARMLRSHLKDASQKVYRAKDKTKYYKVLDSEGKERVKPVNRRTIFLDPNCGRAIYQRLKKDYKND